MRHFNTRRGKPARCLAFICLVLGAASAAPAAFAQEDPPEVALGERLFLETRFAQAFRAFLDGGHGVNQAMTTGDPVMDTTVTLGQPFTGPFAGTSMNCRACHLVDEHVAATGGGMRSYNDFARRSPIPHRIEDNKSLTPRNSPPLVNASLDRTLGPQLHFDAEFASLTDLVAGTLTGRNYGYRPGEKNTAISTVARVIREDDGSGSLAGDFGGLSYATVLTGTDPSIPVEFQLPPGFRVNVLTASDAAIFAAVNKLIAAYTQQLAFSTDPNGNFNLSPFDVFLEMNSLPRKPNSNETPENFSRRLMAALAVLETGPGLQFVASNPNTGSGGFDFHTQPFVFGSQELAGLKIFMKQSAAAVASPTEIANGGVGNCISCHAAPRFTDFGFHNTGTAQEEYDAVHGVGSFAALAIPSLTARNANPNLYLPATDLHPNALEPFRAIPDITHPGSTDLGVWNILANPDMPNPQSRLNLLLCQQAVKNTPNANLLVSCSSTNLLAKAVAMFKTPGLRDLDHSGPYMHTGRFDTLTSVVDFYRTASISARAGTLRNGAEELRGIALKPADLPFLVAFLKSLDEDYQ